MDGNNKSAVQSSRVRVIAWAVPRAASTVFMKSICANDEVKGYFEPYTTAEHFGPDGRLKAENQHPPLEPSYTMTAVKKWLETDDTMDKNIFVKDLAYAVEGRYNMLPDGYQHSILIRKPSSVYKSFYRVVSRMEGDAIQHLKLWLPQGDSNIYKALYDLADHVENDLNQDLVVIDSDDIVKNPAVMMKKYCESVGLRYTDGLLQWEKGLPESWNMGDSSKDTEYNDLWFSNASRSTGWVLGNNTPPANMANEEMMANIVSDMIAIAEPYYEKLRNHPKCLLLNS